MLQTPQGKRLTERGWSMVPDDVAGKKDGD